MKQEDTAPQPEIAADIPTKCIQLTRTVTVNAAVTYIDFEGRSDGESLQKILAQLRPRRVVLVRGSQKDTEVLAQQAQNAGARVFIPGRGETLDATTETHIYQVISLFLKGDNQILFSLLPILFSNANSYYYFTHRFV